jgi:hypothetical protein
MDVIEPTMDYDFSKLYLGPPSTLAGGAYFTRIMYNNNKGVYLQTPKCLTKQGFVKNGKKIYTDLMFDNNDTVFINWIESLENKCQELLFSKGENWFQTKLEKDDIETAFTSPFKIYKSGKFYLLRVNVKPNIKIYNEADEHIKIEDITAEKTIISILEIQGIKFTSRNFQIEIELKQSMIVSPDPFLDECFIKKPVSKREQSPPIALEEFIQDSAKDLLKAIETQPDANKETNEKVLEKSSEKESEKKLEEVEPIVLNNLDLIASINEVEAKVKEGSGSKELIKEHLVSEPVVSDSLIEKDNVLLEVTELEIPEDPSILKEVDLSSSLENSLETITLKKPNQVYYEIYQKAREKAKEAKKNAILAYLELKNIKKTYMLEDIDESDSEFENDDESEEEEEQED